MTPGSPEIRSRWCATPTSTSGLTRRSRTATPTRLSSDTPPAKRTNSPRSSAAPPTSRSTGCLAGDLNALQTQFANRLYIDPSIGQTTDLILNTRVAPFTDVRVRQALNYAIDRDKIARLYSQDGQPICQVLEPYPRLSALLPIHA